MTSLHWQTSLQTQKGHALMQSLKGTGYGLDFDVKKMTLLFCFFTEALPGASSNTSWHCWIMCCFWERFTWSSWVFFFFSPGRTLKQCRTHQGWFECSDGWHCQILQPLTWDLAELISCSWRGCSLEGVWDTRVACSEDCMWSRHVSITF